MMFEEAARLIRQVDDVLSDGILDPRTKAGKAIELANQASDAIRPFYIEHDWKRNPWPLVEQSLGREPLRHADKINQLLDSLASGAIPSWCLEWLRASRPA
jgi:hypothetical protein